jgi:hypothetical protein
MYDAEGFPVANPIDRYAIGDRNALDLNEDGSPDLYIQHENPGRAKESNWLPSPARERRTLPHDAAVRAEGARPGRTLESAGDPARDISRLSRLRANAPALAGGLN